MWSFKIWGIKSYLLGPLWPRLVSVISHILFWLAFTLLIVALAEPTMTKTEKIYLTKGSATMIVLDESPSMAAKDFGLESRFESAKIAIKRFVVSRENDEIGLVTFSKESALRVPLTQDYNFFNRSLDKVRLMEMGNGTSIGMGLAMAALHLNSSQSNQKNVILITDGANNSGEIHPDAAVEMLASMGIKVFTVGIGRKGIKDISFIDPYTNQLINAEINDESYDEQLLRSIAKRTSGSFYRAETFVTFDALFQAIDAQENSERRYKLTPSSTPYRNSFMLVAFLLITLSLFLRTFILKEAL